MFELGIHADIKNPDNPEDFKKWAADGFTRLFIWQTDNIIMTKSAIQHAKEAGFTKFVLNTAVGNWQEVVLTFPFADFYFDEPKAVHVDQFGRTIEEMIAELKERSRFVFMANPNATFTIGDIRWLLQKDFNPKQFPLNVRWTYTSYMSTWILFGKPRMFGLPYQGRTWERIHRIIGPAFNHIWLYGKTKMFNFGDEYKSLAKVAKKLGIEKATFYHGDFNWVDKSLGWLDECLGTDLQSRHRNFHYNRFLKHFRG